MKKAFYFVFIKVKSLLLALLLLCLSLYLLSFLWINLYGKNLLLSFLNHQFAVVGSLENISVKFPAVFTIENFGSSDFSFKKAVVSLGIYNPFISQVIVPNISVEGLEVTIKRDNNRIYLEPFMKKKKDIKGLESKHSLKEKIKRNFSFRVEQFTITKSSLKIIDLTKRQPVEFILRDARVRLKDFVFPQLTKFHLWAKAVVNADNEQREGNLIDLDGWVDYYKKDMNVDLKIHNMDYGVFNSYYPFIWKQENIYLKEGLFTLSVNLNSYDNDLFINGEVLMEKYDFAQASEDTNSVNRINFLKAIFESLKGNKEKPSLSFTLRTKMDAPQLNLSFLQNKIAKIFKGKPTI